jgi:hypothetical protein
MDEAGILHSSRSNDGERQSNESRIMKDLTPQNDKEVSESPPASDKRQRQEDVVVETVDSEDSSHPPKRMKAENESTNGPIHLESTPKQGPPVSLKANHNQHPQPDSHPILTLPGATNGGQLPPTSAQSTRVEKPIYDKSNLPLDDIPDISQTTNGSSLHSTIQSRSHSKNQHHSTTSDTNASHPQTDHSSRIPWNPLNIKETTKSFFLSCGRIHRPARALLLLSLSSILVMTTCWSTMFTTTPPQARIYPHMIPPTHSPTPILSNMTLRQVLSHPDGYLLGMAPAFFGFYGYFGALDAWHEHVPTARDHLRATAGASAGAIAAVLLAAGMPPRIAAEFGSSMTLGRFADGPGWGAVFRGDKFEQLMESFLRNHTNTTNTLQLQDSAIPVAVSAFDLQTLKGQLLTRGSMARAARASATFPGLFEPVGWVDGTTDYVLVDGGIADMAGLEGIKALSPRVSLHATASTHGKNDDTSTIIPMRRVINLKVGSFYTSQPPGPSYFATAKDETNMVVSIALLNLPPCGPWAMANGPRAVEAAYRVMEASLDLPLYQGHDGPLHYEMHLDATSFWPQ